MHDIPPEVTTQFLVLCMGCPRLLSAEDVRGLTSLRLVCAQWNSVIESTPNFWKGLSLKMDGWPTTDLIQTMEKWFSRAGDQGRMLQVKDFRVYGNPTESLPTSIDWLDPKDVELLDFLIRTKWAFLSLSSPSELAPGPITAALVSYVDHQARSRLSAEPIITIDQLHLCRFRTYSHNYSLHHLLAHLQHSLKSLRLDAGGLRAPGNVITPTPQFTITPLTRLRLDQVLSTPSLDLVLLRHFPNLTDLCLAREQLSFGEGPWSIDTVQRLVIRYSQETLNVGGFRDCQWPSLQWIKIQADRPAWSGPLHPSDWLSKKFTFPHLVGVSLEGSMFQTTEIAGMLKDFPSPEIGVLRVSDFAFVIALDGSNMKQSLGRVRNVVATHDSQFQTSALRVLEQLLDEGDCPPTMGVTFWVSDDSDILQDSGLERFEAAGIYFKTGPCPANTSVEFWDGSM